MKEVVIAKTFLESASAPDVRDRARDEVVAGWVGALSPFLVDGVDRRSAATPTEKEFR